MSDATTLPVGSFAWHQHVSPDPALARAHYAELLAGIADPDDAIEFVAGPGPGAQWVPHVAVDDVDAAVARANGAGSSAVGAPDDVPGIGHRARLVDPRGLAFAVLEPAAELPSAGGLVEWEELVDDDLDAAERFYPAVFGWGTADRGGAEFHGYRTFLLDGERIAGLWKLAEPAHWRPYFRVPDIEARTARATGLGCSLLFGPSGPPSVGVMSVLRDPLGAVFGIIAPA